MNNGTGKKARACISLISCYTRGALPLLLLSSLLASSCRTGAICEDSPCAAVPLMDIVTKVHVGPDVSTADFFVFNDDGMYNLDTYQRLDIASGAVEIMSTSGQKNIAVVTGCGKDRFEWAAISTRESIQELKTNLRDENPDIPFRSASTFVQAGGECNLELKPLMSRICIQQIKCDFRGKSYRGEKLAQVRFYLINANASCGMFQEDSFLPSDIVNAGRLKEEDLESMEHPELIMHEWGKSIGEKAEWPGTALFCYPNSSNSDEIGSPFTRLVIEGRMMGTTYFYPINLTELRRGCQYEFCITITGTGVLDPDSAIEPETVALECTVSPWKDKGERTIVY